MHTTEHALQRMSQRGINRDIVELVLENGFHQQDKMILNRKRALALHRQLQRKMRVLMKVIDKGGVTVVADNDALITTYNCNR
jgi:hypothetical protein